MKDSLVCIGFQKEYTKVNLKLKEENPQEYEKAIIAIHISEVENGYRVKKVYKAYKKGTKVTFITFKDEKDYKAYVTQVADLMRDFIKKYGKESFYTA